MCLHSVVQKHLSLGYNLWLLGFLRSLRELFAGVGVSDHPKLTSELSLVLEPNWSPIW